MRSAESVMLANPLSSDMDVLRPSLLPGLIHSLRHNVSRKNYDVALFEIGRVFQGSADGPSASSGAGGHDSGQELPALRKNAAWPLRLTGQRAPNFWSGDERDAKFDAFDLKGVARGISWSNSVFAA